MILTEMLFMFIYDSIQDEMPYPFKTSKFDEFIYKNGAKDSM